MKTNFQEESLHLVLKAVRKKKQSSRGKGLAVTSALIIGAVFIFSSEESKPKKELAKSIPDDPGSVVESISDAEFLKVLERAQGALITHSDGSQEVLLPDDYRHRIYPIGL